MHVQTTCVNKGKNNAYRSSFSLCSTQTGGLVPLAASSTNHESEHIIFLQKLFVSKTLHLRAMICKKKYDNLN